MPTRTCGSGSVPSGSGRPARARRRCSRRCRGCGDGNAATRSAARSTRGRSGRWRVVGGGGMGGQVVFRTCALGQFARSHDPDVRYGGTRALNRAMAEFCATDERLLAVGYLPLNEPGRAIEELDAALELGVAAVWLPSEAPGSFSPAHVDL